MGRSPLPNIPRLARRGRRAPSEILLACPRISPQWELAALKALIKPQTKDAILYRPAEQNLSGAVAGAIASAVRAFGDRTGYRAELYWAGEGDYHFVSSIAGGDLGLAQALGLAISRVRPELWLTCGRLLVRDGRFYRRRRGVRLELVEATGVRVPKDLHRIVADVVREAGQ